jgi:hypothetical protein
LGIGPNPQSPIPKAFQIIKNHNLASYKKL